jgi:predicted GTPase
MPGDDGLKSLARTIARLEELLERLPLDVAKDLRLRVATLRTVLLDKRPPALVLVGRRGAGKSSLVNALLGAHVAELGHVTAQTGRGRWYTFERGGAAVRVLDTLQSIAVEIRAQAPDVIVFVAKASEVDAAVDADLDALETVATEIRRAHRLEPPILAVVTHCDLLEPKATKLHEPKSEREEDLDEKKRHVTLAEHALARKIEARDRLRERHVATVGVSAYMSWRTDGSLRADERWHIEDLASKLFDHLPDAGRAELARATQARAVQEELAKRLTSATAALCAGVAALTFIPLDVVTLTALQVGMVAGIAWIGGRNLDRKDASEFMGGLGLQVGAAVGMRQVARSIIKFLLPAGGAVVSAAVAFAGTSAIGSAATAYYIRGVSLSDARRIFRRRKDDEGEGGGKS